jgi:hypothetical protein
MRVDLQGSPKLAYDRGEPGGEGEVEVLRHQGGLEGGPGGLEAAADRRVGEVEGQRPVELQHPAVLRVELDGDGGPRCPVVDPRLAPAELDVARRELGIGEAHAEHRRLE